MNNSITKKIAGQDRGFKFNVKTFEVFSESTGVEFGEMGTHFTSKPFKSILSLMCAAVEVYNKGKAPDEYEVADWIDELSDPDFPEIFDCFQENFAKYITKLESGKKKK